MVTVLLLTVFLLMIGGVFLGVVTTDFTFQKKQDASEQAYFLALSGVEFYLHQPLDLTAPNPLDSPRFPEASPGVYNVDSRRRISVFGRLETATGFTLSTGSFNGDATTQTVGQTVGTTIYSTGQVFDPNGDLIAQRTVVVPHGLMTNAYEQ